MIETIMIPVMCEIHDVSKFLNVNVSNIAFETTANYLSGVCDIDGNETSLPSIHPTDNIRKIIISWLLKYMPDKS